MLLVLLTEVKQRVQIGWVVCVVQLQKFQVEQEPLIFAEEE